MGWRRRLIRVRCGYRVAGGNEEVVVVAGVGGAGVYSRAELVCARQVDRQVTRRRKGSHSHV